MIMVPPGWQPGESELVLDEVAMVMCKTATLGVELMGCIHIPVDVGFLSSKHAHTK